MSHKPLTRLALVAVLGFAVFSGQAEAAPAQGMVAAANPLAADAGLKVLQRGGDAADAAVAIQATLGLVEPQSSGLGGGAFMLFYDGATGKVTAYNGREAAPAAPPRRLARRGRGRGSSPATWPGRRSHGRW